jgi:ferric-dicitrate binding protein FerR (iron transport regulator)
MDRPRPDAYVAAMTDGSSRHEREEAARREALRTLGELRERDDIGSSALTRAARRATDHFAARDATTDAANDPIELWGRRIGRALSLVAFVGLAIYLYVTYFAR